MPDIDKPSERWLLALLDTETCEHRDWKAAYDWACLYLTEATPALCKALALDLPISDNADWCLVPARFESQLKAKHSHECETELYRHDLIELCISVEDYEEVLL